MPTPPPITRYASAARWGETARDVGEGMGRELASLGLNLVRAGSRHQQQSCQPGDRRTRLRADAGGGHLRRTSLHRGHGDSRRDGVRKAFSRTRGHQGGLAFRLPVLNLSPEELEARELKPFVAAIRAGIEMIMTSHIVFSTIDRKIPQPSRRSLRTTYCAQNAGSTASSYPTMSACTPWTVYWGRRTQPCVSSPPATT